MAARGDKIRRNRLPGVLSVGAISFSAFVLGLFGLSVHNLDAALGGVERRIEVVGYLLDDAPPNNVEELTASLEARPEVEAVTYVSKVEALDRARRELVEFSDVFELDLNPLPASLHVRLREGFRNTQSLEAVAASLEEIPFVEEARFGGEWVERLMTLRRIGIAGTVLVGGVFAVAAVMLIGMSIHVSILARREEIEIMQILGATDRFIRGPFLVEGVFAGILGALLAFGSLWLAYQFVISRFTVFGVLEWLPHVYSAAGFVGFGLLGLVSATRAVKRELGRSYG